MPLEEEWSSDLLKRISSIYKEIEFSTLTPDHFSNPSQNNHIPWPSPLPPPPLWTASKLVNPGITSHSIIWVGPCLKRFLSRRQATGSRRPLWGRQISPPRGPCFLPRPTDQPCCIYPRLPYCCARPLSTPSSSTIVCVSW